jgi:hypothetical protein
MVKNILVVVGVCWGIYLIWFFLLFFLQQKFSLSDDTVRLLLNAGGVVMCIVAFIWGLYIGK